MAYEPRGRYWDDFKVGQTFDTPARTIEASDVSSFAGLTGDFNPLHTDEEFARRTPFGTRIAHGMLTLSISNGQLNQLGIFEGTTLAFLGMERVRFTGPVRFGDTLYTAVAVRETRESSKPDRGVVAFEATVKNQRGEAVLTYAGNVLMRRKTA